MFPAETFNAMQKAANKADFKPVQFDHSTKKVVVYADGTRETYDIEPPRLHQLLSVDDIGRFVDYCRELGGGRQSVWISPDGCDILMRDEAYSTREDRGSLTFTQTPLFALIADLNADRYNQAQVIRMLRTTLYDAFLDDNERTRWIGRFKSLTQTTTVERGSASQKIGGSDPLESWPDFLTLHTRVFDDPVLATSVPHTIRVNLEMDPATKVFELIPLESHLVKAIQAEVNELTTHIRATLSEETHIFRGRPVDPDVLASEDE